MNPLSRRFCVFAALAPLFAGVPASALDQRELQAKPPETNADLPAPTLYAMGTRMLREGRTFEKAAALLTLAATKEPTNPAPHIALGCAYASRAASVGYAAMFTQMLAQEQADYPNKLKKWGNGRADFEKMKAQDPEGMGKMNYDDWKPAPPPPVRGFVTKDDGFPFLLTLPETLARASELCQQARQAWQTGIALCKKTDEKAEALYVQAWGLRLLNDYLAGLGSQPFNPSGSDTDADSDRAAAPTKSAKMPAFVPSRADAVTAITEALRLVPNNALYAQAFGDFLWNADEKAALVWYEKAAILAPKNVSLLYFLYAHFIGKDISAFNQSDPAQPKPDPFAASLGYLHRVQARDRANAWPLYEEAAIWFRLAPYSVTGPSGDRNATPEQKQKLLQAVQNKEARTRGKRATDLVAQGNGLPRHNKPRYEDSVPRLLEQAWKMNVIRLIGQVDLGSMSRLRELARSIIGYAQVMARYENNAGEAAWANRACIGMGYRLVNNWSTEDDVRTGKSVVEPLVGIAISTLGYKELIAMYQAAGDRTGADAAQKESDAFAARAADYKKAVEAIIKNDSIYAAY